MQPVDVDLVRVTPEEARISVTSELRLAAELSDRDGNSITGHVVTWSTNDDGVVEVDSDGLVRAVGPGEAIVRATVEGKTGTSVITVPRPPRIVLDRTSVGFTTAFGSTDPPPVKVDITNGGEDPLERLEAAVSYADGGPVGWLSADLAATRANTSVTLAATLGDLAEGSYEATVAITAPDADNSPVTIAVIMDVRAGPPGEPSDLTAQVVSGPAIELGWSDNSSNEGEFQLERRGPGDSQFDVLVTLAANTEGHTDHTVAPDGAYRYRVRACGDGGCSSLSNEASATTPPRPPTSFAVVQISGTEIELSWDDPNTTTTELRLERQPEGGTFSQIETLVAGATGYIDIGLTPGSSYTYRLRACNGGGCSGYSPELVARTDDESIPNAPTGLTATVVAGPAIDLTWTDNSTDETEFRVERRVPGASEFARLAVVGTGENSYQDDDVSPDARYTYRVRACGPGGCSEPSNEASATTPPLALPAAPSDLSAIAVSELRVDLVWADNSDNETGFEIERKDPGGSFVEKATQGSNVTTWSDRSVQPDREYVYRVRACVAGGCSDWSNEATVSTGPPEAPTSLVATKVKDDRVELEWQDNSVDETEFVVRRSLLSVLPGSVIARLEPDVTTYRDEDVDEDRTYWYVVLACNPIGCSESNRLRVDTDD